MGIGKLEKVDLREVWQHEAKDFSTWLSQNLEYISELMGDSLSLVGTEVKVAGSKFSIDISAENQDGESVIIENLQVSETSIEYINDKYSQTGFFDINGNWLLSDQLPALSATLSGDINFLPLNLEVSANVKQSDNMHPGTAFITADLGEKNNPGLFSLSIEASTDSISTFENSLIRTSISGHDTDKLLGRLGYSSLQISELRFQGNTRYSQDNVFDSSYALTLDDSSATTNFVVTGVPIHAERAVELPMLSGSIEIEDLFLDSFMQTDIATKKSVGVSNSVASKHLFSEKPYGIFSNQIIPALDVNISVERFFSGGLLLKGLNAELKKQENEASLIIDSDDPDTGQFQSTLHITKTGKDINGKLDARILGLAINDVLTAMDVGTGTASGKISGEAKFWFDADSPAMAAKTLDGGMFLIVEQGKLDSLLIEMAGIDFMESIGLVVNRDPQQSEIRCGYADFQASNGLIEVEDFIVDTEDSVFLASGNINLREETINLKLSPHPRDTSYFAATTPIHVRGALTNPKFRPGRKLYTRLALAAAMATLAGPAAVVLPFIELGTSSENSYCKQLFEN
jgi:hypothetical protein